LKRYLVLWHLLFIRSLRNCIFVYFINKRGVPYCKRVLHWLLGLLKTKREPGLIQWQLEILFATITLQTGNKRSSSERIPMRPQFGLHWENKFYNEKTSLCIAPLWSPLLFTSKWKMGRASRCCWSSLLISCVQYDKVTSRISLASDKSLIQPQR